MTYMAFSTSSTRLPAMALLVMRKLMCPLWQRCSNLAICGQPVLQCGSAQGLLYRRGKVKGSSKTEQAFELDSCSVKHMDEAECKHCGMASKSWSSSAWDASNT